MTSDTCAQLHQAVAEFSSARGWDKFHDPKNLSMALASEAGELVAVLRWVSNAESDVAASTDPVRQQLLEEMGDVGILLVELCNRLGVNIGDVIGDKLNVNAHRYPVAESHGRAER
jgi:dCTP diphosphatase